VICPVIEPLEKGAVDGPGLLRPHFVHATARVHEYPDGRLAIFHGSHRLNDYDHHGNLRDDANLAARPASAVTL
jgi:hypothetical protein